MSSNHSRRQFIRNLSLGAAALTPAASSLASLVAKRSALRSGIALVGLGNYSAGQLGPALLQTKNCYLAGIVTGTPSKVQTWKEKYSIPDKNIYNYDNFDSIANNPDIDIV